MKESRLYETEMPLQEILEKMKKNTYYNYHNYSNSSYNKEFLNVRTDLFKTLQKITMKMGFKSQTYFLSIYYLDIIIMKKRKINFNLYKLALGSLCISAKFCENDPNVPQLQYFIRAYNNTMGHKNIISMSDLMYTEVLICKLLNYKLNYYTMYDFNSFFFCHGILKFEQIKEMENEFNKNIENKNNKIKNNELNINTFFVKNILGKIYKRSRDYLDQMINIDKISLKYSPLYINILIIKKSIGDILKNEFEKNCEKDEEKKEKFIKKNYVYFREIMNDFYKIDYESKEQYKQLIRDEEIQKIIKENKNKNDNNKEINNNENNDDKIEKNKKFNNSTTNGFYKRLKIPTNNDLSNISNTKKFNINNNDDLNSNLNINELRNSKMIKNDKINYKKKINKIPISRINTYNTLDNNIKEKENNIIEKIKTESNSPYKKMKSNKFLNFKKINKNKKEKIKSLNEKVNNTFDSNEINQIKLKNNINLNLNKKPYLKKLITLNNNINNKEAINSITNKIKASTTTHFYSSKIRPLQTTNTQLVESYLKTKNFIANSDINSYTYISSFYNKSKEKTKSKKCINTSIGQRYRKRIKTNLNSINKNENIKKDYYTDKENKEKEKIKYITSNNFYPYKLKKIMVNINKVPEMKNININNELKTKRLSLILSKKNSELNNTLKEINKSFGKNIIDEFNKNGCITSRNNNIKENDIKLNMENINIIKNENINNSYKKLDLKKMKYDKKKNISINVNKNNKKIKKAKNNSINISNDKFIPQKFFFKNNNSINNINDGSLTSRENKIKYNDNKTEDKFQSSVYRMIQKTKNLFYKKEREKDKEKRKQTINDFYKTQQNFYKRNKNNKNINEEKSNEKAYIENTINKMRNNEKAVNQNENICKKNSSTIIINNNININIGNKNNIKIPQLKLNNAILNTRNGCTLNNKYNTQRNSNINNKINNNYNSNANKKTINLFHKMPFSKKLENKGKK